MLNIYLGEKELIALTKKGFLLINWGSKKLLDKSMLVKQVVPAASNFDSLFEVFSIAGSEIEDVFCYCPEKKVDNSNRLYYFDSSILKINGYPTGTVLGMKRNIRGMSVGKYYCLCWDDEGSLFSWGCKSIGLGYIKLPNEVRDNLLRIISKNRNRSKSTEKCSMPSQAATTPWLSLKRESSTNGECIT